MEHSRDARSQEFVSGTGVLSFWRQELPKAMGQRPIWSEAETAGREREEHTVFLQLLTCPRNWHCFHLHVPLGSLGLFQYQLVFSRLLVGANYLPLWKIVLFFFFKDSQSFKNPSSFPFFSLFSPFWQTRFHFVFTASGAAWKGRLACQSLASYFWILTHEQESFRVPWVGLGDNRKAWRWRKWECLWGKLPRVTRG